MTTDCCIITLRCIATNFPIGLRKYLSSHHSLAILGTFRREIGKALPFSQPPCNVVEVKMNVRKIKRFKLHLMIRHRDFIYLSARKAAKVQCRQANRYSSHKETPFTSLSTTTSIKIRRNTLVQLIALIMNDYPSRHNFL